MAKKQTLGFGTKFVAAFFALLIAGYISSNYLLSNYGPHEVAKSRLVISAVLYIIIGYITGWFLPKAWWLAVIADWGLVLFSFVALSYSLTHGFADFLHSFFPPLLILLTLVSSRMAAQFRHTRYH